MGTAMCCMSSIAAWVLYRCADMEVSMLCCGAFALCPAGRGGVPRTLPGAICGRPGVRVQIAFIRCVVVGARAMQALISDGGLSSWSHALRHADSVCVVRAVG